jgi:hypothetical protein
VCRSCAINSRARDSEMRMRGGDDDGAEYEGTEAPPTNDPEALEG